MFNLLQLVIVAVVVLAAAAYLGLRIWRRMARPESASGCRTACGTCPQNSAADPVIPLDALTTSTDTLKASRN
jgi:hypothetical protein